MENWGWAFGAVCLLAALAAVLYMRTRTKRTLDTVGKMVDQAAAGNFSEEEFDESRLSALETRFAHYLSASAVSARNVAEEKDRIKTLIGDISHQTKTPIANLLLHSELLLEEELPPQAKDNAEALHLYAEKLRFLIDSLVKLSRLENGILTLSPKRQPVSPLLALAADPFAKAARAKGLSWSVEETEALAEFDLKWTAEALGNVLDNAVKYTSRGGVRISVVSYELFVRIDVKDSGIGIPEEEQAKIFSRFYRSRRVSDEKGVGIGLYLAREILSGEGGYIKVSPVPGGGSCFSLYLPR